MIKLDIYFKSELKDSVVDMLLEDGFEDFFYFPCSKYAASALLQSTKEKVSGRQDYGMFVLVLEEEQLHIANKIRHAFGESNIHIFSSSYQKI